jgi:hypothetical protein
MAFSHRKWTVSVVALACDFNFLASRFLAGLTAILSGRLHEASARQMPTLYLLIRHHDGSSLFKFFFLTLCDSC